MTLRLGRLPATRPHGLSELAVYAKGKLPAPPASVNPPKVRWGVDLNDSLGDCTIAGVDHLIGAWDVDFHERDARPDDAEIKKTYFMLTGGEDSGLVEADVLRKWQTTGLFGNKVAAYAPVHPKDVIGHHQAIAFYGGAYLGIACPKSVMDQFSKGEPWTYVPHSPIEGGHCIVSVGYDAGGIWCVSWGELVYVTYPFFSHYLEEVWCVLGQELVEAKRDSLGIDIATLQADLESIR